MCTFKDERTVQICDVAIGRVRQRLQEAFGDEIQYTTVPGQGTLAQASSTVDAARFQSLTREVIVEAQGTSTSRSVQEHT